MTRAQAGSWARRALLALALVAASEAGPLPNVTVTEMTTKAPTCAIGDVVYALGEQFTGSGPCERCSCGAEGVRCARRRCEPRAGCKAVHRPDSCCPTYQCECEQDGRVYANGEKLVDPLDPCRVCYCQGGEVVCRRIACFVRDDCRPRLVPGRCCPEYDNCPLRGVSSTPGTAPSMPSISTVEDVSVIEDLPAPSEKTKVEITIKEITPVSEIPIVTDVKIKEVLPSQSIEIVEYPSSKSPLITREVTSEKYYSEEAPLSEESSLSSGEHAASSTPAFSITSSELISSSFSTDDSKSTSGPSKISLSTLDSSRSEILTTNIPSATSRPVSSEPSSTRGPAIEEDDPSLLMDHNPAFPPIPDDLSVPGNHEDDMVQETNADVDHVSSSNEMVSIPSGIMQTETSTTTTTEVPKVSVTSFDLTSAPTESFTTAFHQETKLESTTYKQIEEQVSISKDNTLTVKSSPMLNLRSAIPTELLNVPLTESEVINGELDDDEDPTPTPSSAVTSTEYASTTDKQHSISHLTTSTVEPPAAVYVPISTILHPKQTISSTSTSSTLVDKTTESDVASTTEVDQEQVTGFEKSNIATEPNTQLTSRTDLSSLPIETTDQNPPAIAESNESAEKTTTVATAPAVTMTTAAPTTPALATPAATAAPAAFTTTDAAATARAEAATTAINIQTAEAEPITVSSISTISPPTSLDNYETTEFLKTFGSAETSTDSVELIKQSNDPDKRAALIDNSKFKNSNVLNDLIKLVGDVASISDHSDETKTTKAFSNSEELIPVNAGYKSKNNNWNLNSITEVPPKIKGPTSTSKAKIVEIEDDDDDEARVSELPAGARGEPTTRRPVIDHVSDDDAQANQTSQKDIEIITKSYVPTINRRPTKVVMQKNSESSVTDSTDSGLLSSVEDQTEDVDEDLTPALAAAPATAPALGPLTTAAAAVAPQ